MPSSTAVAIRCSLVRVLPRIDGDVNGLVAVFVADLAADEAQRLIDAFEAVLVRRHRFEIDSTRRHQLEAHLDGFETMPAHAAEVDRLADDRIERETVDRFVFERGSDEAAVPRLQNIE